jgi:hypothetical protein
VRKICVICVICGFLDLVPIGAADLAGVAWAGLRRHIRPLGDAALPAGA